MTLRNLSGSDIGAEDIFVHSKKEYLAKMRVMLIHGSCRDYATRNETLAPGSTHENKRSLFLHS